MPLRRFREIFVYQTGVQPPEKGNYFGHQPSSVLERFGNILMRKDLVRLVVRRDPGFLETA